LGHFHRKRCRILGRNRAYLTTVIYTCDPRDRGRVQAIQSPRLIVEVLSPTTELTDRTWKLKNYCAHPTIEEYVLVDSQSLKIESYHKEQNRWIYEAFENTDDFTLHSFDVHFSLADAYIDVEFEAATGDTNV
jgi:Uma2 family endonuclease